MDENPRTEPAEPWCFWSMTFGPEAGPGEATKRYNQAFIQTFRENGGPDAKRSRQIPMDVAGLRQEPSRASSALFP